MNDPKNRSTAKVEIIKGVEGPSVYINDKRICGSKPWGGGQAVATWNVPISRLIETIQAMREPTQAMLVAARNWSHEKYGKPIGNDAAIGCWQAMIDEVLSPNYQEHP